MTYAEVKTGDVIDGVKITDVEKDDWHLVFTFDIIGGGWSFLVVYPCNYWKEARFKFNEQAEEEAEWQTNFLDQLTED